MTRPSPALAPFAFLWAFALLYHQVAYGYILASPVDTALGLMAGVVMIWPHSGFLLATLAGLHATVVFLQLPQVTNHWYFGGLVSVGVLLAAATAWWPRPRQSGAPFGTRLAAAFSPVAQACLLLLYGLSGLHKLNHDFFTPAVSCASVLTGQVANRFHLGGVVPDPGMTGIWLTVMVELGLPLLLAVRRVRVAGILLALGFHVVMAAAGYPRFSATGVALLTLLLPAEAWRGWSSRLGRRLGAPGTLAARGVLPGVLLAATWAGSPLREQAFLGVQWLLTLGVAIVVVAAWHARLPAPRLAMLDGGWRLAGPAWAVPLLVLTIAATPYLGLGTHRALSMYSNLRTEGGTSNHLLIPASLQVFPYQRDLVAVHASSAASLQDLADRGLLVPWQELRALLTTAIQQSSGAPVSVEISRGGVRQAVPDAATDAGLALPVSRAALVLLRFRPVEAAGPRRCSV